ncbi:hypothetical protein LI99_31940 [Mycolicibacterium smegmatis]|uniref:Uncharacterized protein n=1 Tax=Mycolicibacterium smegmatis (strain ATCC 700084 / mc(2)155) TaxID=246196 RepID=A0R685_MYCS2|nr:hypothetical protein MSMEG_6460 [Mycolicibacterium smegmatis MC2 155]AIU18535.1 hypothetical protein LI99_31940 [Mycolicibacterium smegmatis]AIU11911.1 hypothetical protein LJ00_31935 [Mycolicibacterium smegmatis MC2 155]AIU25158.1 hypothetical protein LI98_31945 [Mycolicibacterium smegmatis]TBH45369.1 hypothetical protein EYS45_13605 [Mycolicibacterium smegmatis MC2 155]
MLIRRVVQPPVVPAAASRPTETAGCHSHLALQDAFLKPRRHRPRTAANSALASSAWRTFVQH